MTRTHCRAIVLLSALSLAACDKAERSAPSRDRQEQVVGQAAAPTEGANAEKGDDGRMAGDGVTRPAMVRKLIQTAELHVQVESYSEARAKVEQQLQELGGFVADAHVEHHDGEVSYAELTIRVPTEKLGEFLAGTAGQGDVIHETLSSQDITEGYYDMKARLKNAQKMEARLVEILGSKTDTLSSVLEVERELARVREQIEVFEGKLRLWDEQVSLSTVKLRLVSKKVYAVSTPPTLGGRLSSTFGGSWEALVGFGQGLLIFLVALAPWLLPLGLLAYAIRRLARRWSVRRQAAWTARVQTAPGTPEPV